EDDHPREVAEHANRGERTLPARAHLAGLGVLEELLGDALVALVGRDTEKRDTGRADQPRPGRPAENAGCRSVRVARLAVRRTAQDLDRQHAQGGVHHAAGQRADTVEGAVARLRAMAECGAREAPEGVSAEADR